MSDKNNQKKKSLKVEILEKLATLMTTGFGLVAALAWNDTIKMLFSRIFDKPEGSLLAMFGYSIVITIIVVILTIQLGRLVNLAKNQLEKEKNTQNE